MDFSLFAYVAILLLVALLSTRLVRILKLPNVTGYIVTGILIGPCVINLIPRDFIKGTDFISDIALAFIAFTAGQFFKMSELKKAGWKVVVITLFEALANDLNTSNALAELYNILKDINQQIRSKETDFVLLNNLFKTLTDMFYVLGLDINYVKFDDEISSLYKEYLLSKENKDFAKSDEIRKILIEKGVM